MRFLKYFNYIILLFILYNFAIVRERFKHSNKTKSSELISPFWVSNAPNMDLLNDVDIHDERQLVSQVSNCSRVFEDDNWDRVRLPFNITELRSISYEKNELIGEGGNGKVFNGLVRVESMNDEPPKTMQVAVKTADKRNDLSAEQIEKMAEMRHPNVIRTFAYSENDTSVDVIMELCWGSLEKLMNTISFELSDEHKIDILLQIADGMAYYHSNNIVHRDLKPANVVLNTKPTNVHALAFVLYKIIDPSTSCGTIAYMSPEAVDDKYSKESDVYAFGILTWELLTEQQPFEEFTDILPLAYHIGIKRNTPPIPDDMDEDLAELLKDTWRQNLNERPTFAQIIPRLERIKQKLRMQSDEEIFFRESTPVQSENTEPIQIAESNQRDFEPNVPDLF